MSTLILHRVTPRPDDLFPGEVDARRFDAICAWVKHWFNVLPLDEAARMLREGRLPSRAMAITFDDGYEDNCSVALPILRRHGLPATFFVTTGVLDGGCMWNDRIIDAVRHTASPSLDVALPGDTGRSVLPTASTADKRAAIQTTLKRVKYLPAEARLRFGEQLAEQAGTPPPTRLMLDPSQVRHLRQDGMQIGAHTVSHPILAKLTDAQALAEVSESRRHLESIVGEPIALFAYPNGQPGNDYAPRDVMLVKECGFAAAVSTVWGAAGPGADLFQLPRFTPWASARWKFGAQLLGNILRGRRG